MLSRLAVHYYRPDFTQGQAHLLIEDMLDDLSEFTASEVEVAIRNYRLDPAEKYFPRAAQLRSIIFAERKHRAEMSNTSSVKFEFGDSRPFGWEYHQKRFWKAHWKVSDLDQARDPDRRARYDAWIARKESSDAS